MSENWRKYQRDPRYLIALLPGIEIAIANLEEERDSIRDAIARGRIEASAEPARTEPAAPLLEAGPPARKGGFVRPVKAESLVRRAQRARQKKKEEKEKKKKDTRLLPSFDSSGLTRTEFLLKVIEHNGGQASNDQIRQEAARHEDFAVMADRTGKGGNLSVLIADGIHRTGLLKRISPGVIARV